MEWRRTKAANTDTLELGGGHQRSYTDRRIRSTLHTAHSSLEQLTAPSILHLLALTVG